MDIETAAWTTPTGQTIAESNGEMGINFISPLANMPKFTLTHRGSLHLYQMRILPFSLSLHFLPLQQTLPPLAKYLNHPLPRRT